MKGAAAWATLMRSSEDTLGSLMMPNKKSSGDISGFAAAAASAAFLCAVFLFGVPRWRPPRLSPGFDPLGMAIFRSLLFWPINPLTRPVPFLGRRGPNRSLKRNGISALVVFQEPQANEPVDICYV